MDPIPLPESLKNQLAEYKKRLRLMETLLALSAALTGLLLCFLILFILDRFFDTPRTLRLCLAISGSIVIGGWAYFWTRNWIFKPRNQPQLAKLLQKTFRKMGDRLQGAVELTTGGPLPDNISPSLCRAAVDQVAGEAKQLNFLSAVSMKRATRWLCAAVALCLLIGLPLILIQGKWLKGIRHATSNSAERYTKPLADIERYTFASLESLPDTIHVPIGESFNLPVTLTEDSVWKPAQGRAQIGNQPVIVSDFMQQKANYLFPPQISYSELVIRVGDATKEVAVQALPRPELTDITARIDLPHYLGHPPRTLPVSSTSISVLKQSSLGFTATASRTLSSAEMKSATTQWPATISDRSFTITPRPIKEFGDSITLNWLDRYQLAGTEPYKLTITPIDDQAPNVEFLDLDRQTSILLDDVLKFQVVSEDDFGVKESWVEWVCSSSNSKGVKEIMRGKLTPIPGGQLKNSLAKSLSFSPQWHKIPDDTIVELTAYSIDYLPDRKPSASWTCTVNILSKEKHAKLLQDRMEDAYRELDDRIRAEETHLEENQALQNKAEKLESQEGAEDIKKLEGSERANKEILGNLLKDMGKIIKDGLRNKEIPEATISKWSKELESLEKAAQPSMDKAADKLKQASTQKGEPKPTPAANPPSGPPQPGQPPPPSPRKKSLEDAQKEQEKAVAAMRQTSKSLNAITEDLTARNFYNRIKRTSTVEFEIATTIQSIAPDIIGLNPEEIGTNHKDSFNTVASRQSENTEDVRGIIRDLIGFYKRTKSERHGKVREEMEQTKIVNQLDELNRMLDKNLSMRLITSSRHWGKQLDEWAEKLKEETKGGSGSGKEDPEKMALAIKLLRAAKEEDNIREQTDFLELTRSVSQDYNEETGFLAARQEQLADTLKDIAATTKIPSAIPMIRGVENEMRKVTSLLRHPQTDEEVISTESSIIEALVPPPKDSKSPPPPPGSPMAQMQEMQRELTKQMQGTSPSLNFNGGTTNRKNNALTGTTNDTDDTVRAVEKSGSAINPSEWPEEYRDSLQNYFDQIDQPSP